MPQNQEQELLNKIDQLLERQETLQQHLAEAETKLLQFRLEKGLEVPVLLVSYTEGQRQETKKTLVDQMEIITLLITPQASISFQRGVLVVETFND